MLDALGNLIKHDSNRENNYSGCAADTLEYLGPHLVDHEILPLPALRDGGHPLITTTG